MATHIQVDYRRSGDVDAAQEYRLVVQRDGTRIAQRSYAGAQLQDQGVLELDVLGGFAGGGNVLLYVEVAPRSGEQPVRASNALSVDLAH